MVSLNLALAGWYQVMVRVTNWTPASTDTASFRKMETYIAYGLM